MRIFIFFDISPSLFHKRSLTACNLPKYFSSGFIRGANFVSISLVTTLSLRSIYTLNASPPLMIISPIGFKNTVSSLMTSYIISRIESVTTTYAIFSKDSFEYRRFIRFLNFFNSSCS